MTFRFFGDSWFWTWTRPEFFKSSVFKQDMGHRGNRFSTIKHLFRSFGYDVVNHCMPGSGPLTSIKPMINLDHCDKSDREIWIWFMSNVQRDSPKENFVFDKGLDAYIESYDNEVINILSRVNNKLVKTPIMVDVPLIVIGGHTGLPRYVFDKVPKLRPNMLLMTENLSKDLFDSYDPLDNVNNFFNAFKDQYDPEMIRRFLFCSDNYFNTQSSDDVDKSIEEFFLFLEDTRPQYNRLFTSSRALHWPDMGHLGFTGQLCLADMILKFCEDNNLLKT